MTADTLVPAVVAATSPLAVHFWGDPADVTVPANTVSSYAPTIGDDVRVELRTPLLPLIVGRIVT